MANPLLLAAAALGTVAVISVVRKNAGASSYQRSYTKGGAPGPRLCREFNWTDEEQTRVQAAILTGFAEHGRKWSTMSEARTRSFDVTRAAVSLLCPAYAIPPKLHMLPKYKQTYGPAWTTLWDLVTNSVWNQIVSQHGV